MVALTKAELPLSCGPAMLVLTVSTAGWMLESNAVIFPSLTPSQAALTAPQPS